jgi:hypothetical protein
MRGAAIILGFVLLGCGFGVAAQDNPASVPAPAPAPPTRADREAALIDDHLGSLLEEFSFADCAGEPGTCTFRAVPLHPLPDETCAFTALVEDRVIRADGSESYAFIADHVLLPHRITVNGETAEPSFRNRATAFRGIVLFDEPGFQLICLGGERRDGPIEFTIKPGPYAIKANTSFAGILGAAILGGIASGSNGGHTGSGSVYNGTLGSMAGYGWTGKARSFGEGIGTTLSCFVTGCPGKLQFNVHVLGTIPRMRIYRGDKPTPYTTDRQISVPRGLLGELAVQYPDGTLRRITDCRVLATSDSARTYLCG